MNLFNVTKYGNHTLVEMARELTREDFIFTVKIATPETASESDLFSISGVPVGIQVTAQPKSEITAECDDLFLNSALHAGWHSLLSCDHPLRSTNPFFRLPSDCKDWGYPGKSYKELTEEQQADVAKQVRKLKTFTSSHYSVGTKNETFDRVSDFRGCRTNASRRKKLERVHKEMRAKFNEMGGVEAAEQRCVEEAMSSLRGNVRSLNANAVSWVRRQFGPDSHPAAGWKKEYVEDVIARCPEVAALNEEDKFLAQQIQALQQRHAEVRARAELALSEVIWRETTENMPESFLTIAKEAHQLREERLKDRIESKRGATAGLIFGGS